MAKRRSGRRGKKHNNEAKYRNNIGDLRTILAISRLGGELRHLSQVITDIARALSLLRDAETSAGDNKPGYKITEHTVDKKRSMLGGKSIKTKGTPRSSGRS